MFSIGAIKTSENWEDISKLTDTNINIQISRLWLVVLKHSSFGSCPLTDQQWISQKAVRVKYIVSADITMPSL